MGKKADLTRGKKAEIKALVNAKLLSNRKISRRLEISEASIRRIKQKIESGEELIAKRKKKCGRKPIFTPTAEQCLKKICFENRFAITKLITSQLQGVNVNASERTVRRKLIDLDFKACRPARKPKLTPSIKAKRLTWAKQFHDKDLDFRRSVSYYNFFTISSQIMYLTFFMTTEDQHKCSVFFVTIFDRSASVMKAHLKLQNKAQFVRRRHGEKFHPDCVVQTVKHPIKMMIWSVISSKGTGRLDVVNGMMKQDQFKNVLQNQLILQLKEWFPNVEPFTFKQDGALCQTARSVKAFLAEQNIIIARI
ncbi:uncharacterized protein LOC136089566 [Hydra vulgaris]|uniref:Uncharacterized protein LOC136089566 n=1 Tax=Hydra vulgaris TaxID=6087 RepID=A0ABM4DBF4_HYDVU